MLRKQLEPLRSIQNLRVSKREEGADVLSEKFSFTREQQTFFKKEAYTYDKEITGTNFWKSVYTSFKDEWKDSVKEDMTVLDLGCGTGNLTIELAKKANMVIGIDVSIHMIKKAILKIFKSNLKEKTNFVIADAHYLPIKNEILDGCYCQGALHHLADPKSALIEQVRVLKNDGKIFCLDNNKTPFRPIFDVIMKICKIWNEVPGKYSYMNKIMIKEWLMNLPIRIDTKTIVFLPPHIINVLNENTAIRILKLTNKFIGKIPILKNYGGILIIKIRKMKLRN